VSALEDYQALLSISLFPSHLDLLEPNVGLNLSHRICFFYNLLRSSVIFFRFVSIDEGDDRYAQIIKNIVFCFPYLFLCVVTILFNIYVF